MSLMPRKTLALLTVPPLTLGLAACFDMDVTINGEKGVPLSEIELTGAAPSGVTLAGSDKVYLTKGDALEITVEGSDEAKEAVRFVLDGNVLGITRDDSFLDDSDQATIRVTLPAAPKELVITGSGSMETQTLAKSAEVSILGSGKFTGGDATVTALDVNLGGSGMASLGTLTATSLDINIGGSGSVMASGTAKNLSIYVGGSGDADLEDLKADYVEVAIAGSGNARLKSDGVVGASIMGSGNVHVEGTATCEESSMGSGSLNCPNGTKS